MIEQLRFIQETEQSIKDEGYCFIEQNTVVIDSINKDNVIARCVQIGAGVFCYMRPCKQCDEKISLNLSEAVKKAYSEAGWQIDFDKIELIQVYYE